MPTNLKVEVVEIGELEKHPNADTLSIVKVKGWQCIVKTEEFKGVKLAAYIPVDALIPESLLDRIPVKRIKTIKLRGIISQGVLFPAKENWKVGDEVSGELGITKYAPPEPTILGGEDVETPNGFIKYTDIERIQNYPNVLTPDTEVVITEKIHGTNFRVAMLDGKFYVGSHTRTKKRVEGDKKETVFWQAALQEDIEKKLRAKGYDDIVLFGEIFGSGIQKLHYGCAQNERKVAFYDIWKDHRYLDFHEYWNVIIWLELPRVPLLYQGKFGGGQLSSFDERKTYYGGSHNIEGVVIKPLKETWNEEIGRVILKYISPVYLLNGGE